MTNFKNIRLMAYGMYLNISLISAYCAKDVSCFFDGYVIFPNSVVCKDKLRV